MTQNTTDGMEVLEEAVRLLREQYDAEEEKVRRFRGLADHHAANMKRLGAALSALGVETATPRGRARSTADAPTARDKILALLEEFPRAWSVPEMIREYESRREPFLSENPDSAVRAALKTAIRREQVQRTPDGRYTATKWTTAMDNTMDTILANGSTPHPEPLQVS